MLNVTNSEMKHILELKLTWGTLKTGYSWGVDTGSYICEEATCETCEFRFACYTTGDVVVECNRTFSDYNNAMLYRKKLRRRFPRSRIND